MKKSARRHDSLIPLSREHQYALLLCLRIDRGLAENISNEDWLRTKVKHAVEFFDCDLKGHFNAEEQALFPAMRDLEGAAGIIDELISEHTSLAEVVDRLRAVEPRLAAQPLKDFAGSLETHIRKEERMLFPIFEKLSPPERIKLVGNAIVERIGSAAQPRDPELLT